MIRDIRKLFLIIFILIILSTLGFASASSDSLALNSSVDNQDSIAIDNSDGIDVCEDSNENLDDEALSADFKDNDCSTLLEKSDSDGLECVSDDDIGVSDGDGLECISDENNEDNIKQTDFDYPLNSIKVKANLKSQNLVYISPDGDEIGSGSLDDPTTWENAINLVDNDGTIVFLDGEYILLNQFLDKNLTLRGSNSNAVISGTSFVVSSGNSLNIENLIFTDNEDFVVYSNGTVNVKDSRFENNSADILIQSKNANIVSSNFTGNNGTSVNGANITVDSSNFINNNQTPVRSIDDLIVKNSSFINNTGNEGGALYSVFNTEVYDSNFINNSANIGGGINAVYNLTVENSNFEGNNASVGAAVMSKSSEIKDSNFTNNTAIQGVISSGNLNIDHSVFNNNTAVSKGVIFTENATISNSKFNDNKAEDNKTIFALNDLIIDNDDISSDEIEVCNADLIKLDFENSQMVLENGDRAYCIQKSNPIPYDGAYIMDDLDFVLNQITGEDVSEYLKILISQNLENEDYSAIQEAVWIFTDGNFKASSNELVRNALTAYNRGTRISTQDARVALSNGTWVALNFTATSKADAQNLLAYHVEELGVPNLTVVKKSLNPITDWGELAGFEIEVRNNGEVSLNNITVNETYSYYLRFISWESISGQWSSTNNRTFSLSKLDVGESASFRIIFNATTYGNFTNAVNVKSIETGIVNASNNTFVPTYGLSLTKMPSSIDNIIDSIIYYNITIRNTGTGVLHDVNLTDILPDSEVLEYLGVFDSSANIINSEIDGSNARFYFGGDLEAGETFFVVLKFKALKNETGIINNASVVTDKVNRSAISIVNVYNPVDLAINKTALVWYNCTKYGPQTYRMVVNFTVAVKNVGNKTLETVVVEDYGFDSQYLEYQHCPEISAYIYRNGRNESVSGPRGNFNYTLSNLAPGETAYVNFLFLIYTNQTGSSVTMNNSAYAFCPQEDLNKSTTDTFVLYNPANYTINKTAVGWLDCPENIVPYGANYIAYNFTVTVKNTGAKTLESLVVGDYGIDSSIVHSVPEIKGYIYRDGINESNGNRTGPNEYTLYNLAPGETAYVKFVILIYTDRQAASGVLTNYAYAYYPNEKMNKTNSTQFKVYAYTINKTANVLYNYTDDGVGAYGTNWMAVNFTAVVKNTGPSTIPTLIVGDYGFDRQYFYSYTSYCKDIKGYIYRNGRNESNGYRGNFNYTLSNLAPGETAYVNFLFYIYLNATVNQPTFINNSVFAYEPTQNLNKSYTNVFSLYKNASYTLNKTAKVLENFTNYGVGNFKSNLFAVNFTVTVKNTGQTVLEKLTVGDYGFDMQYVSSWGSCPEISGYIYRNGRNVSAQGTRGNFNYTLFNLAPGETAYVDFLFLIKSQNPGSEIVMNNSAYGLYYNQNVSTTGTYVLSTDSNLLIDKNATVIYNYTLPNGYPYFVVNYTVTVENIGDSIIPYIDVEDFGFDYSLVYSPPSDIRGYVYRNGEYVSSGQRTGNYMYTLSTLNPGEKAYINFTFLIRYNQSGSTVFMNNSARAILPTNNVTVTKTFELLQPMYYTVNKTAVSLANLTIYGANTLGNDYFAVNFTVAVNNTGQGTINNLTVTDVGNLIPSSAGVPDISAYAWSGGSWRTIGQRVGTYDYRLDGLKPGEVAYVNYIFYIKYNHTSNLVWLSNSAYASNPEVQNNQSVTEDFTLEGPTLISYKIANVTENYTIFDIYVLNLGNETITDVIVNDSYRTGIYERYSVEETSSQLYGYINLAPLEVTELENAVFSIEKLDPFSGTVIHLYFKNNETGIFRNLVNVSGIDSEGDEISFSTETPYTVSSVPTNISIAKETVTPTVHLGDQAAFDIIVSNGGDNSEDLIVEDRLFDGLIFDHADPLPDGVSLTVVEGIPKFNVSALAPHSSLRFRLYFNTTKTGNFTNTAFTNASASTDYVINASNKTEVLPMRYALESNKTALNKTVYTNVTNQVEFNISVANTGWETLNNILVSESQFDGLEFVSYDPDRSSGDWQIEMIDGKPAFKLASLERGATANLLVVFNASQEGNLTNIALVGADNIDQEKINASLEVIDNNMTFGEIYNLSGVKTALNKTVDRNISNETEFNITVKNTGNRILTNVVVRESDFKGLKFVSFDEERSSQGWILDLSGDSPVFKLESLDVGASANIIIRFNVTKTGNISNIATVSADNVDETDVNDTIKSILVRDKSSKSPVSALVSDFSVEKIASNDSVILNEFAYYDIIVKNDGLDILHNIVVSDLPDEGLVYVGIDGDSDWKKLDGDELKFKLEILKPGHSSVLRIFFNATKLGSLKNDVSVSTGEGNVSDSTETIEVRFYNMTVVKETVTPIVNLGEEVVFDILVRNTGSLDLTGVVVNDTGYDKSALSLVSFKSIKGNWTGANGIYTLEDALAPEETAIIRLTFKTLKTGSFNNTAIAGSDNTDDVNSTNETSIKENPNNETNVDDNSTNGTSGVDDNSTNGTNVDDNSSNETSLSDNSTDNENSDENESSDEIPPRENANKGLSSKTVKDIGLATGNPILVLLISLIALFTASVYTKKR